MSDPIRDLQQRLQDAEKDRAYACMKVVRLENEIENLAFWLRFAVDREDCVCFATSKPPCWVCTVRDLLLPPPPAPASPAKENP